MIYLDGKLAQQLAYGGSEDVLAALQQALKLEVATIPPYLYALYSLIPGCNNVVARIIESVVIDEMLHATLVANVMNALGGRPRLDPAHTIPDYPSQLPGSVEHGLVVPLAPCSKFLIGCVFMEIEEPEVPLDFQRKTNPGLGPPPGTTIGSFYRAIMEHMIALSPAAFSGAPDRQIGPHLMPGAVVVTDCASACEAISTIIDQGEGTATSPLDAVNTGRMAHYYRFAEIVYGGQLVKNPTAGPYDPPESQYFYDASKPIPFDAAGIYGVATNPRRATYKPGSVGQVANDNFNYTYTTLFTVLDRIFDGEQYRFDSVVGLMMSLRQQALDMMSGTDTEFRPIGPSFEYQPVNPGLLPT